MDENATKRRKFTSLVAGNNAFATNLYQKIRSTTPSFENIFFSPFSISIAIAMAYSGARGDTREEIENAMQFTLGQPDTEEYFKMLTKYLIDGAAARGITLAIANGLWVQESYPILEEFINTVTKSYAGEVESLDFKQKAVVSDTVNAWVSNNTNGRIDEIMNPDYISDSTKLILTNAIYFLGKWVEQFDPKDTKPMPFYLDNGSQVETMMMYQVEKLEYAECEQFQVLEMGYQKVSTGTNSWDGKDYDMSMLLFLPRDGSTIADLEGWMTPEFITQWVEALRPELVKVYLPRFTMTCSYELKPILAQLGMKKAFTLSGADFTGISTQPGFFIEAVAHKAFVKVDEEGTEAAAVTMIMSAPTGPPPQIFEFKADHSFLFLIRDKKTKTILFLGRTCNPPKE